MSLTTVLGVTAGLFSLFLVLSLAASAVNEGIAGLTKRRARTLETAIIGLLAGDTSPASAGDLKDRIYAHPLIRPMQRKPGQKPSYIPASAFVPALLDTVDGWPMTDTAGTTAPDIPWAKVDAAVASVANDQIKNALRAIAKDARMRGDQFRAGIERWYDDTMERVSGWYTRRTQLWLWIIGAILVLLLNADSVMVGRTLWSDPTLRDAVAAQSEEIARSEDLAEVTKQIGDLDRLQIPLGWNFDDETGHRDLPNSLGGWLLKAVGLLVTAAAISMGATFWFDLLKKVANIRSNGPPPAVNA